MCTKEIGAKRSVHVQYAVRDPYMEQAETFTPQSPWRPKSCGQKPLLFRPGLLALTLAYLSCLTLMCNVDMTWATVLYSPMSTAGGRLRFGLRLWRLAHRNECRFWNLVKHQVPINNLIFCFRCEEWNLPHKKQTFVDGIPPVKTCSCFNWGIINIDNPLNLPDHANWICSKPKWHFFPNALYVSATTMLCSSHKTNSLFGP